MMGSGVRFPAPAPEGLRLLGTISGRRRIDIGVRSGGGRVARLGVEAARESARQPPDVYHATCEKGAVLAMRESFSTSDVARYCHVTPDTIRKWAEAGRIRVFKTPGGHRRIRREDLLRFLQGNQIPLHPDLLGGMTSFLVIAPDQAPIDAIREFLEKSQIPFQLAVAMDSFDAGRHAAGVKPDVVFLDLQMRAPDASEICRRLRSLPDLDATTVIGLESSGDGYSAAEIAEHGVSLCVRKPINAEELRSVLAQAGVQVS